MGIKADGLPISIIYLEGEPIIAAMGYRGDSQCAVKVSLMYARVAPWNIRSAC